MSAPACRQGGFRGGNNQLQGRSAVYDKLPHGHNDRLRCALQRGLDPVLQQTGKAVIQNGGHNHPPLFHYIAILSASSS